MKNVLKRTLLPLVALAAGSLIGGAFFHMIPAAIVQISDLLLVFILAVSGFTVYMALEQFMPWHHVIKGWQITKNRLLS